ncbi:MAG: sigma-70 family RNA polymerase sigma factor [Bacteroidaceae bacterium]|nr:sigma-70 family RNA polymerase sigma factor [Bacteroidaceae bacterium]
MDSDALIQRAKEKDPKAFDIIYRTYYPKMVGICMNIIREDRATACDLVHDAFILAFVSIRSLRDNTKFYEWLTSIVRNVSLKHIEQRDRIRILPISSVNEEDAVFMDLSSSPESDLSHRELLELISTLPEGYSKILRLSVIEGYSHKEIAEMLGIEPHSSSSQLSRAKRVLKRMIAGRIVGVIAILLISLAGYYMFRHEEGEQEIIVDTKHHEQIESKALIGQHGGSEDSHIMNTSVTAREKMTLADHTEDTFLMPDTDSVTVNPQSIISDDILISETVEDSLGANAKAPVTRTIPQPGIDIAEGFSKKTKKWQFLAAGSLGPALVQSVYKLIATNSASLPVTDASGISSGFPEPDSPVLPEPDIPSHELPDLINTWEDYGKYLKTVSSPDVSADTLALIEIANQNTGEIEQKENHDKPVTFGMSLTKTLGKKWGLETGLQYSILHSRFSMGENGYAVASKQKVHYLGILLRVSYNWIDYKHLSAYSSTGVTMHMPVYGKVDSSYFVDGQDVYSENRHFTPSLQWQTSVSIGLQYKFTPNTSIFVEPTFNWFVPSGSDTHTIWTEHPFMFTCPFGVRITW